MTLTSSEIIELKRQLSEQIKHLPHDQRAAAQKQIDVMSPEALEAMLIEQKSSQSKASKDIYRAIISGEIPSKKIDENKYALAVLEIRPISKGHIIIIPKEKVKTSKELPNQVFSLAKKLSTKVITKLKAKSTEIQTQFAFGEIIVNVIPIYDKSLSIDSGRTEIKEKELEELYKTLKVVKKPKIIKIKKSNEKVIRLNRKVP